MHREQKRCNYRFFSHTSCEYFPCHPTEHPERFNCMFCYCPLYALGRECGGNFQYIAGGIKDCSACLLPHKPENYDHIMELCRQLSRMV
jgi:Zn-finger protein